MISTKKGALMPCCRNRGRRMLSTLVTASVPQRARPTAGMVAPENQRERQSGPQTSAVPTKGMGATTVASSPQKAGCLMPATAKPIPHRTPWAMATRTMPSMTPCRARRMARTKRRSMVAGMWKMRAVIRLMRLA